MGRGKRKQDGGQRKKRYKKGQKKATERRIATSGSHRAKTPHFRTCQCCSSPLASTFRPHTHTHTPSSSSSSILSILPWALLFSLFLVCVWVCFVFCFYPNALLLLPSLPSSRWLLPVLSFTIEVFLVVLARREWTQVGKKTEEGKKENMRWKGARDAEEGARSDARKGANEDEMTGVRAERVVVGLPLFLCFVLCFPSIFSPSSLVRNAHKLFSCILAIVFGDSSATLVIGPSPWCNVGRREWLTSCVPCVRACMCVCVSVRLHETAARAVASLRL